MFKKIQQRIARLRILTIPTPCKQNEKSIKCFFFSYVRVCPARHTHHPSIFPNVYIYFYPFYVWVRLVCVYHTRVVVDVIHRFLLLNKMKWCIKKQENVWNDKNETIRKYIKMIYDTPYLLMPATSFFFLHIYTYIYLYLHSVFKKVLFYFGYESAVIQIHEKKNWNFSHWINNDVFLVFYFFI